SWAEHQTRAHDGSAIAVRSLTNRERIMKKEIRIAVLLLALAPWLVSSTGSTELIDPSAPPHALLDQLVEPLEQLGQIDVLRSWSSNVPLGKRARLAPLAGMVDVSKAKPATEGWAAGFEKGAFGAVVGVKAPGAGISTARSELVRLWNKAKPSQRVFVS